jgi:capsule polysaccharide export protein KpsE/RkpR
VQNPTPSTTPVLRFLLLLAAHKSLVLWIVLLSCGITAVYSLVMTKTFESRAVIAPPSGSTSLISGILGDLPMGDLLGGLAGGMGGDAHGGYFVVLLNSRQVHEELIRQFGLREHYKMKSAKIEDLLKAVGKRVSAEMDFESGMIVLGVRDRDPELAHRMAVWLVERLEALNHDLKTKRARNNRQFAEREVGMIRQELDSLEHAMTAFQQSSRLLEPVEQGRALLGEYSEIKTREAIKELELRVARTNFGEDHPLVRTTEGELAALRAQLRKSWESGGGELSLALSQLPAATMDHLRLKRELEIANKKLLFMLPQLEQAKLDEVNDIPVLEVLDPPVVAEKRIKPKRTIMVLTAGLLSMLVASVVVLFLDRLEQDPAFAGACRDLGSRLWTRRRAS